jgi:pimeloyl-[acyl-carrier protein] methyl ester esterase
MREGSNAKFLEAEKQVFAGYSLTPKTRRIRVQKAALTLRVLELGSGEPAFFLHGMGGCAVNWASLWSCLPSFHKIAVDLPGHGGSDDVDFRGLEMRSWYTDLLTGCLDELALESAHIVGHSMGSMFGMWLALDAPQRVRSLIAFGTPAAAFGEGHLPVFIKMVSQPGIGRLALSMPAPLFMYRRLMATMLGRHAVDTMPPALIQASYLGPRGGTHAKTLSAFATELYRGVRAEPPRYALSDDELARIDKPVLIIWGQAEDGMVLPIAEGRRKVALMPNSRFEVVPGGHLPWLDDAQLCADLVSDFLRTGSGA